MPSQSTNPDACRRFITALRESQEDIKDIVHTKIESSDNPTTQAISDSGAVDAHTNNDIIEYFDAFQSTQAYREMDNAPRDLEAGSMSAATCSGFNGLFSTNVNEFDPNACNGLAYFNFAQGFITRSTIDFKFAFRTPTVCPEDFIRMGPAHVNGYFDSMKESFGGYGARTFEDNLTNLVIQYGQANSSVNSADGWSMTTNGWESPPLYRISIAHLRKVKQIIRRRRGLTADGFLVVAMPRQDWIDACIEDATRRNPSGTVYQASFFKSLNDEFGNKDIGVYDGIKCIFNEEPVRGFFKPSGGTTHNFVRVLPYKNEVKSGGGVGRADNLDYDEAEVSCEGGRYPMCTLCMIVHPRSFKRWGLNKPVKKVGRPNVGTNYETVVIDGDGIADNPFNDKFYMAARHRFRFRVDKPEWSGAIVYRHSPPRGYTLSVNLANGDTAPDADSTMQPLPKWGPSADEEAKCQTCYDAPAGDNGTCVDDAAGVLRLYPAGTSAYPVITLAPGTLRFRVTRADGFNGAASVNYTTAAVTAVAGTHYTTTAGTLNWADGEDGDKFIDVPILADVDGEDRTFKVTISGPTGATIGAGDNVATAAIRG